MLVQLAVFSACISVVYSACVAFPNNTDVRERWFECAAVNHVYNVTPFYQNGKGMGTFEEPFPDSGSYEYPVHLGQPVVAQINFDNTDRVYPVGSLRDDVNIWEWGGPLGCSWHSIPTLGLTSNQDSCASGLQCPIQLGRQTLPLTIDFTPFQAIINLLKDDAPYQIQYILRDHQMNDRVVSCVFFQARCRLH